MRLKLFFLGVFAFGSCAFAQINLGNLDPTASITFRGSAINDLIGWSSFGTGDINGDGRADLVIGVPFGDPSVNGTILNNAGQTFVIYGKPGGIGSTELLTLTSDQGFVVNGGFASQMFGESLSAVDLTGDGIDDLLIGAPNTGILAGGEGLVAVVFGQTGARGTVDLSNFFLPDGTNLIAIGDPNTGQGFLIQSSGLNYRAGFSLSGPMDVNGDGIEDVVIGSDRVPGTSLALRSFIHVLYGRDGADAWPGRFSLVDIRLGTAPESGIAIREPSPSTSLGRSVASVGDLNGDGFDDFAVGAPAAGFGLDSQGGVWLLAGGPDIVEAIDLFNLADDSIISQIVGANEDDNLGTAVTSAGDFNGDGRIDIAVGASRTNEGAGSVHVIFGSAAWPKEIRLAETFNGLTLSATGADQAGFSLAGGIDFDGDQLDDVIVGAPGANGSTGHIYVVRGGQSADHLLGTGADLTFVGGNQGDFAGRNVGIAGDLDGDGSRDILIGAPFGAGNSERAGELYVISGTGEGDEVPPTITGELSHALYDPARPGQGVLLEYGTSAGAPVVFAAWYTFEDGEPLWLVSDFAGFSPDNPIINAQLFVSEGTGFGAQFDPSEVDIQPWGSVRIDQSECGQTGWNYTRDSDGTQGRLNLTPLLPDLLNQNPCATESTTSSSRQDRSLVVGTWWNPERSGEGIILDLENRGPTPNIFFSWFTYNNGQQTWLVGSGEYDAGSQSATNLDVFIADGANFGPDFNPDDVVLTPFGTVSMLFSGCDDAQLTFVGAFPDQPMTTGGIDLVRFTDGLADFACSP